MTAAASATATTATTSATITAKATAHSHCHSHNYSDALGGCNGDGDGEAEGGDGGNENEGDKENPQGPLYPCLSVPLNFSPSEDASIPDADIVAGVMLKSAATISLTFPLFLASIPYTL